MDEPHVLITYVQYSQLFPKIILCCVHQRKGKISLWVDVFVGSLHIIPLAVVDELYRACSLYSESLPVCQNWGKIPVYLSPYNFKVEKNLLMFGDFF